jgi:hypothetical protein
MAESVSTEPQRKSEAAKLLLEQLSREYQILQDKIDKIGGFKFTIRGWSVTIIVASSIGAVTAPLPSPFVLLGLTVFVLLFGLMEHTQTQYRNTFSHRCAEIERLIWRLLRDQGSHSATIVPRIAHSLADDSRERLRKFKKYPKIQGIVKMHRAHDEYSFYGVQAIAIVALTIWLASHPRHDQRDQAPHIVSINSINTQPQASESNGSQNKRTNGKNAAQKK